MLVFGGRKAVSIRMNSDLMPTKISNNSRDMLASERKYDDMMPTLADKDRGIKLKIRRNDTATLVAIGES